MRAFLPLSLSCAASNDAIATIATTVFRKYLIVSIADVAHALVRAASRLVSTLGCEFPPSATKRRDESRRGTQECVRHNLKNGLLRMHHFLFQMLFNNI